MLLFISQVELVSIWDLLIIISPRLLKSSSDKLPAFNNWIINLKGKDLSELGFCLSQQRYKADIYIILKSNFFLSQIEFIFLSHFNCYFNDLVIGFDPYVYIYLYEILLWLATYEFFTISCCGLFCLYFVRIGSDVTFKIPDLMIK